MTASAHSDLVERVRPNMDAVCDFLAAMRTDDANNLLELAYLCLRDIRNFQSSVTRKLTRGELQGIADVIALARVALDIVQEIPLGQPSLAPSQMTPN